MLTLNQLTTPQALARDIHDGWITASPDPTGQRLILSYTPATQYAGHWIADTTLLTRGLIIEPQKRTIPADLRDQPADAIAETLDNATVIARGMRKFFTVEAADSDWGSIKLVDDDENVTVNDRPHIDFDAPATVADKLDGALGIAYPTDGLMHISTKGSFTSEEAQAGDTFMREKHRPREFARFMQATLPDWTPLFEIITPGDLHIVRYGPLADIVFLGLLDNRTGWWTPAALLAEDPHTSRTNAFEIPARFDFITPQMYHAYTLGEALEIPEIANHEGMVVTLDHTDTQDMYKIKFPTYLLLNRLKEHLSGKALKELVKTMPVRSILDGGNIDLLNAIPEPARDAAKPIVQPIMGQVEHDYLRPIRILAVQAAEDYERLSAGLDLTDRADAKEYAIRVNSLDASRDRKAVLFTLKKATGNLDEAAIDAARRILLK